jgi:hypothetical protein
MQIKLNEVEFAIIDILEIFEELNCVIKTYIERMIDLDKKEMAKNNLNKIQVGLSEKLIEYIRVPSGKHIAFKELDNHDFMKDVFLLFFKGYLNKNEVEYFLNYITKDEEIPVHL